MSPLYDILSGFALKLQYAYDTASSSDGRSKLQRCGYTAYAVWSFLTGLGSPDFNQTAKYDVQNLEALRTVPEVGKYHCVYAKMTSHTLDHECVIVMENDCVATALQSYVGHYGPRLTNLGSSPKVVDALVHLVQHSHGTWDHTYVTAYDRISRLSSQSSMRAAAEIYTDACMFNTIHPIHKGLHTPNVKVVVRLNMPVPK